MTPFQKWFVTFLKEKNVDMSDFVECKDGKLQIGDVCSKIMTTTASEQSRIKAKIVQIDFANGNVTDYITHLAKALSVKDKVDTLF